MVLVSPIEYDFTQSALPFGVDPFLHSDVMWTLSFFSLHVPCIGEGAVAYAGLSSGEHIFQVSPQGCATGSSFRMRAKFTVPWWEYPTVYRVETLFKLLSVDES